MFTVIVVLVVSLYFATQPDYNRIDYDLKYHYIKMKGKATPNVISELENIFERNRGRNKIHQMRKDVETYEDTVSKRAALVEQRIGCKEARGQDKVH